MPTLRPFRALRFVAASNDLSAVLAPPYDIITPAQRQTLLALDPHNVVRIELPADLGDAGSDDYAAAAATARTWRDEGVLAKDAEPTVTVHEMAWLDGKGREQRATGLLARLKLEEYGPGAGILPHEKTHGGPKEDRYALLEATQLNTSPLVFLAGSEPEASSRALLALTGREPDATARTADGVSHRLWVSGADEAAAAIDVLSSAPLTIADGHHRYETALKYRAHREADRATEPDPAWDYALALVYPLDQSPPALPTHRVLRGGPRGDELLARLGAYCDVEPVADREALVARMAQPATFDGNATGSGRIGLMSDQVAAILTTKRDAIGALLEPGASAASCGLDVNALGVTLEQIYGAGATRMAADGRLWYVKDATEATSQVAAGDADAAFLLDEMPPAAILAVAEAGEVMPQKSTYFDPKAPSGLLLSPLEW